MVLAVHIAPEIGKRYEFLTCLRMPLYFCISGLFFKDYGGFRNFFIKKADKLLIPFVGWYAISYLIYYVRLFSIGAPEDTYHPLDLFTRPDFYNLPIWFLLCLFWCSLLYALVDKFTKRWYTRLSAVFLIACAGSLLSHFGVRNFLFFGTSMSCLPFFYLGSQLKNSGILYPDTSRKKDFIFISCCIAFGLLIVWLSGSALNMSYYDNTLISGNRLAVYLCSASFIIAALLICKQIKRIPYISFLGRYSIIALVTHGLMGNIMNRSIRHIIGVSWDDATFHLFLFGVVVCLMAIIIPLCRKYLPHITAQKDFLSDRFISTPPSPATAFK